MDERQAAINKRKREEEGDISDSPAVDPEKPKADQDLQKPKAKKRKLTDSKPEPSANEDPSPRPQATEEQRIQRKKEQKAEKKQRKKEKKAKLKEKLERRKARKKEAKQQKQPHKESTSKGESSKRVKSTTQANARGKGPESSENENDSEDVAEVIDIDRGTAFAEGAPMHDDHTSSIPLDEEAEEVFSPLHDSGISSSSSIPPPLSDETVQTQPTSSTPGPNEPAEGKRPPQKASQPPKASSDSGEDPKHRLQAAISPFRADRKQKVDQSPVQNSSNNDADRKNVGEQKRRSKSAERKKKKYVNRRWKSPNASRLAALAPCWALLGPLLSIPITTISALAGLHSPMAPR